MGKERKKTCLREIANVVMGISPSSSSCNLNSEGFPLLNGPSEFGSHHPKAVQFTNNPKKFSKKGDLLFCVRGSTGRMNWSDQEYAIGRGLAAIQAKNGQLFSSFIKGCIEKELKNLLASSTGSVFSSVNRTQLEEIPVYLPSNKEITQIENVLGSLERKIEINRKNYETLEEIAQALFKSWLIDFDPVKAKSEGRSTGLPDEISDLFPDSFEDYEFGQIPKGWSRRKLSEIAFLNPESWSAKNYPEKIEYLDLAGVKNGKIQETNTYLWSDAPSRAKRILHIGDTIIGTVRPGNRSFCMIQRKGLTGSTGFAALRPKDQINAPLLYLASTNNENIQRLTHLADGGAYPAVKPEVIIETSFVLPNISIQKIFGELLSPIFLKVFENKKESNHLSNIRNTLLPKLISGELRIPDAEKMIEENEI